jgi:sugar/nucleoside kinase (ribokinase family)
MSSAVQFDYVAVGHVTIDVMPDGTRRPGGTALYSALQAARLGLRTLILTRGRAPEIESLLAPWASEVELHVEPADRTTTLATSGLGLARRQRLLAWGGRIEETALPSCSILHLAPVADELPRRTEEHGAGFVGLTAQGLTRGWASTGAEVVAVRPAAESIELAARCDAVVLSEQERAVCEQLLARALACGTVVALTAGPGPNRLLLADGEILEAAVDPLPSPVEDLGAGDVYAAVFFVALARGLEPLHAARLANAAAALRMEGAGPDAIAGEQEISARVPDA